MVLWKIRLNYFLSFFYIWSYTLCYSPIWYVLFFLFCLLLLLILFLVFFYFFFVSLNLNQFTLFYQLITHSHLSITKPSQQVTPPHLFINWGYFQVPSFHQLRLLSSPIFKWIYSFLTLFFFLTHTNYFKMFVKKKNILRYRIK